MIRHKKNAHMANDFSCEDCDVSFGRSECFSLHDNSVHSGKNTYSCPHCEKQLGRTDSLNHHMKCHHQSCKQYIFSKCFHCEQIAQVGDERVPSGCDYERDDAVADVVQGGGDSFIILVISLLMSPKIELLNSVSSWDSVAMTLFRMRSEVRKPLK